MKILKIKGVKMNIKIISVGKLKEKYLKLGIENYKTTLKILLPRNHRGGWWKSSRKPQRQEMIMIKDKEGDKILSKIRIIPTS